MRRVVTKSFLYSRRCIQHQYRGLTEIKVKPDESLVDDKVSIKISGLKPWQNITVKSSVTEGKSKFSASACFTSDSNGNVEIDKQRSLTGTYTGTDAMGLFWSMIPDPDQKMGQRYMKRDVTTPEIIHLNVFEGHHTWNDCHSSTLKLLISKEIRRWFLHKTVKREEIRFGKLRGTLFVPAGKGPFLGVIDMFGSAGGKIEFRASLLASRGFITYALPYFNFEDLPASFIDLDFDYLKDTVHWFSSHPLVSKNGIGIVGVSKGGELALMLGLECPQVKSVVNINGTPFCSFSPVGPFTDCVEFDFSSLISTEKGYIMNTCFDHVFSTDKFLKTWGKDIKILYIAGEDDQCLKSDYAQMLHACYPEDKKHNLIVKCYPRTGHLIEPPYIPICHVTYHKFFEMVFYYGGRMEDQAKASEDSWHSILNFFRDTLSEGDPVNRLSSRL